MIDLPFHHPACTPAEVLFLKELAEVHRNHVKVKDVTVNGRRSVTIEAETANLARYINIELKKHRNNQQYLERCLAKTPRQEHPCAEN